MKTTRVLMNSPKSMIAFLFAALMSIGFTACSDNDDNPVNPTTEDLQIKEAEAQLLGEWSFDVDYTEELDLGEMRLTFDKDNKLTMGFCMYNYDLDGYIDLDFHATYRVLSQTKMNGIDVQPLEVKLDEEEWAELTEGEPDDPEEFLDTLYAALRGDQILFVPSTEELRENQVTQNSWFKRGITPVSSMNKAKAREYAEAISQIMEDAQNENPEGQMKKTNSTRGAEGSWRDLDSWMYDIPDDRKICRMMIPGTHDAGTYNLEYPWQKTLGKTQFGDWEQQMKWGIRAFDIRTRYYEGYNRIFHSMIDCSLSLDQVLEDLRHILVEHPTEGIILFIKGEDNDIKISDNESCQELLTWLSGAVPLSFNYSRLNKEATTRETVRLVNTYLRKEGLLAKFRPDMTMGDLRGKALVILENAAWDAGNPEYDPIMDYIAISKDHQFRSAYNGNAICKEQNEWEIGDDETLSAFADRKAGLFKEKILLSKNNPNENWWYFNAANAFDKEFQFIPDYLSVAKEAYPKFIDVIKKNPGAGAIIVQDYAGQKKLKRVSAPLLVTTAGPAAFVNIGVGAVESAIRTIFNWFTKVTGSDVRVTTNTVSTLPVEGVYEAAEKVISAKDSHGQELVEAVVDSNF